MISSEYLTLCAGGQVRSDRDFGGADVIDKMAWR